MGKIIKEQLGSGQATNFAQPPGAASRTSFAQPPTSAALQLIVTGPDGKRAAQLARQLNERSGVHATVDARPGDPADAVIIAVDGTLAPTPTELGIVEAIEHATHSGVVACIGAPSKTLWPANVRSIALPVVTSAEAASTTALASAEVSPEGLDALLAAAGDLESIDPGLLPKNVALDFRSDAARAERSRRIRNSEQARRHAARTLLDTVDTELGIVADLDEPTAADFEVAAARVRRVADRHGITLDLEIPAPGDGYSTALGRPLNTTPDDARTAAKPAEPTQLRRAETVIAAIAGAAAGAGLGRGLVAIISIWAGPAPRLATAVIAATSIGAAALAAWVQKRAASRQQARKNHNQLASDTKRAWTSTIVVACDTLDTAPPGWRYRQLTEGVHHG